MGVTLFTILILAFLISVGAYIYFVGGKFGFDEKVLALAKARKFKEAKTLIKDKIDLKPDDPSSHFLLSKVHKLEGDLEGEASDLERIMSNGKFTKDISLISVSNRLANIYYQLDRYEESFFYYLELLESNSGNMEAIIRLSFMAIGQKEFEVADKFLKLLSNEQIKLPALFLAKGVVAIMLDRDDSFEYFHKAYDLDKESTLSKYLYAFNLFHMKRYKEALKIVDGLIELVDEELIKYNFLQFLMVQYICLNDTSSAMLNARVCIDIARRNNWEIELSESCMHYVMFCISLNDLEKSSEYMIEAEFLRPSDPDVISLANYKFDLEEGTAFPGTVSHRGFNLSGFIAGIPEKLFPKERAYDISGLKMPASINIKGIINKEGKRIITKISELSPDRVVKFNSLRGLQYKNICSKIIGNLNYKVKKELPGIELEGLNLLASSKDDDSVALFRFRRWKQSNLSDIFLTEMLTAMNENGADKGFLVASCDLTPGAKKFLKNNDGKITIVNDRYLDSLLETALK